MDILELVEQRHSSRGAFDPERKIPEEHLRRILEGARWAPTAHNMQNFEIVVVDDPRVLGDLSRVPTTTSPEFVEENYEQLSFSEAELKKKKVGLLATMFPPSWRTPGVTPHVEEGHEHSILGAPMRMCSALLVVLHDPARRAPASEGDVLGMISLGCVMENMWLVAESLGVGFQIQSVLAGDGVEPEVRALLGIPPARRIAFAVRLGYPKTPAGQLRVRRDVEDFAHRNRFGAPFVRPPK
jgi:nitroreductase